MLFDKVAVDVLDASAVDVEACAGMAVVDVMGDVMLLEISAGTGKVTDRS